MQYSFLARAPVAQGIEHTPPARGAQVRILPGAQSKKSAAPDPGPRPGAAERRQGFGLLRGTGSCAISFRAASRARRSFVTAPQLVDPLPQSLISPTSLESGGRDKMAREREEESVTQRASRAFDWGTEEWEKAGDGLSTWPSRSRRAGKDARRRR